MNREKIIPKVVAVVLIVAIAFLSVFVFAKPATTPETYAKTIQSIDDKKATVMALTATAAAASTIIASAPGDITNPIANQIMEISEYLFIVVCFLVLEKSLLTVMGYLSFKILIPAACALLLLCVIVKKDALKVLAAKIAVFSLVIVAIIPFSVKISDMIYEMNSHTVDLVMADVDEVVLEEGNEEEKNLLGILLDKVGGAVSDMGEGAKKLLNRFVDAIALFVIAYCVLPILVVFVVIWFIKFLFEMPVPYPNINLLPKLHKKNKDEREEAEV